MKTYSFLIVFFSFILFSQAQNVDRTFFKAGFHGSMPVGDAADVANFGLGVDLYQHWGVSKTFDVGLATGFTNAFVKDEIEVGEITVQTDFENIQFIPAAGFFRFYPSLTVNLGCDVGYAFGINEDYDGGFYYRPTVNIDVARNAGLYFSYTGINNDGSTFSTVTGGMLFLF